MDQTNLGTVPSYRPRITGQESNHRTHRIHGTRAFFFPWFRWFPWFKAFRGLKAITPSEPGWIAGAWTFGAGWSTIRSARRPYRSIL